MSFADFMLRVQSVDTRIIRVLVFLAILIPLVNPLPVPMVVTDAPRTLYDFIEQLPPGSVMLVDTNISAAYRPTLYGTAEAVFSHAMRRGLRVVLTSFAPEGPMFNEQMIESVAVPAGKVYGVDYVHLGYRAGGEGAVAEVLRDFHGAYDTDFHGNRVADIPIMQDVRTARDVSLVVIHSAGGYAGGGWVRQAVDPYGLPLAVSVTGVMAPSHYPYTDAGQIIALLSDMKSGAEYETLIQRPGVSLAGMGAQTFAHILIILLIFLSNVSYFANRGRRAKK